MEILEDLSQALLPTLVTVLTAIISYVGVKIKSLYETHINTEEKEKVVEATVKYVKQIYNDLSGKEKLEKAIETATQWLEEKNIKVTQAEINVLIESAVQSLNSAVVTQSNEENINEENINEENINEENIVE